MPKFGGSYLVWGACVVFFQAALLLGYAYSHFVIQKFRIFPYRFFHLILLFLPLLCFPGRPLPNIYSHQGIPMAIDAFGQLLFSIGLVFFVLSTTSIIFQSWLAASQLPERLNPYILYAVSNLGSFLALLSYPFFFEAYFDLGTQLNIWRVGYLFLLGVHLIAFRLIGITDKPRPEQPQYNITAKDKLRWFLLAAAGVIAFLSVTNIITYEVAPAPLLWIIPLCIYLISFVLNFKERPFCPDWIKDKFHLTIAFSIVFFFLTQQKILPFAAEIIAYSISLFIICMFCQSELVRNKPKDTEGLTIFYLVIAFGSFIGGMFINWVIPLVSTLMIEYLLSLFVISCALIIDEKRKPIGPYYIRLIFYTACLIMLWPLVFPRYNIFGLILIFLIFKFIYTELKTRPQAVFLSLLSVLCIAPSVDSFWTMNNYIYSHRNYYGIYKIYEKGDTRFLMNGTTLHGAQYVSGKKEIEPLTYYHRATPVGNLMASDIFNFNRTGIVGLGAGTLAVYGKTGQAIDFFELDPDVFYIANKYFTYLKNSQAKINYIFGDARVSLNKVSDNRYNLLIIDAFSGDSVPIHLLTTEAISEYRSHLTKDGIILFHVSNRYLNLVPVLFSNARVLNAYAGVKSNFGSPKRELCASVWVVLTWSEGSFKGLTSKLKWDKKYSKNPVKYRRPWTDLYSNILSVFRLQRFLDSVKEFQPFYW